MTESIEDLPAVEVDVDPENVGEECPPDFDDDDIDEVDGDEED